jgi:probable rRNA maturation factor
LNRVRRLQIRNRQRRRSLDARQLKVILTSVLKVELSVSSFEVCIHLVGSIEMTRLNETFLGHAGSTDVITFNHLEQAGRECLHGEIFVCVDEAVLVAPRYRSSWPAEVVRYAVHGLLHLQGYDDQQVTARRRMKRVENRIMQALVRRHALGRIARPGATR